MGLEQIASWLDAVSYKDWDLIVSADSDGVPYLQWTFCAPDYTKPGQPVTKWHCRKYRLSVHMTEGEVVQTAFHAALQAEEHECREAFCYRGRRPFNPHIRLDALLSVCDNIEGRV